MCLIAWHNRTARAHPHTRNACSQPTMVARPCSAYKHKPQHSRCAGATVAGLACGTAPAHSQTTRRCSHAHTKEPNTRPLLKSILPRLPGSRATHVEKHLPDCNATKAALPRKQHETRICRTFMWPACLPACACLTATHGGASVDPWCALYCQQAVQSWATPLCRPAQQLKCSC